MMENEINGVKKRKPRSYKKIISFANAIFILAVASIIIPITLFPAEMRAESILEEDNNNQIKVGKLTFNFDYGFDQCVKYGRNMGFNAEITNEGEYFAGHLQVLLPNNKGNNTMYQQEIIVEANSNKKISLTIPLGGEETMIGVKIKNSKQKIILEEEFGLTAYNYGKIAFVGIVSDAPQDLDYIGNFGTKLFPFNKDNLPDNVSLLEQLDVIIIDNFDASTLSEQQIDTIIKWVQEGGSIVFGTGEYVNSTLKGFNKKLFDATILEENNTDIEYLIDQTEIERLKQKVLLYEEERNGYLTSLSIQNEDIFNATNSYAMFNYLKESKLDKLSIGEWEPSSIETEKVELIINSDEGGILEEEYTHMKVIIRDAGNIQIFPFALGMEGNEKQVIQTSIAFSILDNLSETKTMQLENEHYSMVVDERIIKGTTYSNKDNIPKVGKYILILIIYVIIIGPVLYFILKKKDKRNLTWILVPTVAFVFTIIVYVAGSKTRIDEPYIGFVNILNLAQQRGEEKVLFSITAPYNQKYDVRINPKYNVTTLNYGSGSISYNFARAKEEQNKPRFEDYKTAILKSSNQAIVQIKDYPAFTPCYFESEHNYAYPFELKNDIKFTETGLQGTIENKLGYDLNHAVLIKNGFLVDMSTLLNNEITSLKGKRIEFMQSSSLIYNSAILGNDIEEIIDPVEQKKIKLLEYFVENYMFAGDEKSYLIGFTDNIGEESVISSLSQSIICNGITLVVAPVITEEEKGITWTASIDSYINVVEGSYNNLYSFRFMDSPTIIARYNLPNNDTIKSFHYLPIMNLAFNRDYAVGFVGEIYFYNYVSGNYDLVFDTEQKVLVNNPTEYLDEENQLLVKYQINQAYEGSFMSLPYISYQSIR